MHTLMHKVYYSFIGSSCELTIQLPAQSVWIVHCLENGDFVVGSRYQKRLNNLYITTSLSDHKARVFSADETRQASAEQQAVSVEIFSLHK